MLAVLWPSGRHGGSNASDCCHRRVLSIYSPKNPIRHKHPRPRPSQSAHAACRKTYRAAHWRTRVQVESEIITLLKLYRCFHTPPYPALAAADRASVRLSSGAIRELAESHPMEVLWRLPAPTTRQLVIAACRTDLAIILPLSPVRLRSNAPCCNDNRTKKDANPSPNALA